MASSGPISDPEGGGYVPPPTEALSPVRLACAIDVNEDPQRYATITIPKVVAGITSFELVINGSFLLRSWMRSLAVPGGLEENVVALRWPSLWFDVYATQAPFEIVDDVVVDHIDDYDERSSLFGPFEHVAVLGEDDGNNSTDSAALEQWPSGKTPYAQTIPTLTITSTDGALLALFEGAVDENVTVYVKPRMDSVLQSINGDDYAAPNESVVDTLTYTGFLGSYTVTLTPA